MNKDIVVRSFWKKQIEAAWKQKSVVWLMGVRRVGKTSLCESLANIEYFDCEKLSVRKLVNDAEAFLEDHKGKRIMLDEVHRLDNPSEVLKVAADHYPTVQIIATGSSTLGASIKFRDTLTDRKIQIWLTPLLMSELRTFGDPNITRRFLLGGLPAFFSREHVLESAFEDWLLSYWARDIESMFRVREREPFLKLTTLLLANSGGLFKARNFTDACGVSSPTIENYLSILEATFVVHVIRPYSTNKKSEGSKAPKVYGFDTGFVCHAKGWHIIRPEDTGLLWEQIVLNEMHGHLQHRNINHWRDKKGHEVDFVYRNRSNNTLTAIECKFRVLNKAHSRSFITSIAGNIKAFRSRYPDGDNFIVASDVTTTFQKTYDGLTLTFVNPKILVQRLATKPLKLFKKLR